MYLSLKYFYHLQFSLSLNNDFFVSELVKIIVKCESSLNEVIIYTTKTSENRSESYVEKELRLYSEKVKTNVQYNIDWLGGRQKEESYEKVEEKERKIEDKENELKMKD